ncbi:DUF2922 domain-containing protein [Bacillus sp. 1P06AnD]|uniref:DUF2922 domain-containing protein n=1 Tax=Bacillus sp. 1P06AnD TaxID=3132208 RepID=UPI0039A215D3
MATIKTLEMVFLTDMNKNITISIDQPKEPIELEKIKEAMDIIISEGAMTSKTGKLASKKDVRVVERTVNEYSL